MRKISTDTIIRTVLLVLALINQCLTVAGKSVIPIDDETVTNAITLAFTIITSLVAWWKNNSFTQAALIADELLKAEKNKEV